MEQIPVAIVDHMRRTCPARTDEALQDRFGISYNTWCRIDAERPIRRSLAQRIIARVGTEIGY